jgi:hypothetical protein
MITPPVDEAFVNISQRAVSSYLKSLTDFMPVPAEGENEASEQEQRDLHAFFQALYSNLYVQPESFGLPVGPDSSIAEDEPNAKEKKQAVKRLLDKPRKMIATGLDFLMQAGTKGSLEEGALRLENYAATLEQSGVKKKYLAGLDATGLAIALNGDRAVFTSSRFAAMMPALQALATRCAAYPDQNLGRFLFACCDFRALGGYKPQALDLYRAFDDPARERVTDLHAYFSDQSYKTEIGIHAPFAWNVKYQGDRKIKATPLFQVDYDDRYSRPLRMQIKCASTQRLAALLPKQPQLLRDDFMRRANICRGDECNWCQNQKTLGSTTLELNGETRTFCWYTNPDVRELDDNTVELIRQYERMHAELAPEN